MGSIDSESRLPANAQALDGPSLDRHFGGGDGLLSLWIAEPYVALAPSLVASLERRAGLGWYGYEVRHPDLLDGFWSWMATRHGWSRGELQTVVSPSVGTSIGVLLQELTAPGDNVILQPPVFTDFKPLVNGAGRNVVRNPLELTADGYRMDLGGLEQAVADPGTTAMILCNPHNPVGRVWSGDELDAVARLCAEHGVFVIADEIHADLTLAPHRFTPFASVGGGAGVGWAALHGPIKTFGLAGVCDTVVVTEDHDVADRFESVSSRLHLTRNNVFGMAAFQIAYEEGADWLDELLTLTAANADRLAANLPEPIRLVDLEGTYLAWLDFRALGLDVPELADWLARSARLALSPGHWFGREGAGFARMTVAAPTRYIEDAIARLHAAL